ncbi:septal ring lytic transglycosylase RlpA family protein [Leptothoe kymatousa]|uniref:Probable endolytic peptidoglycan transglycosylase RlpA n=1 Tax=Leptothoe kymatousa TAU-MAC 1615 TaxID=2364775 RepID=A0ABS5Y798_9CYAN|nr:septal ring lytic transglycosylase RlpA family protein [Leptothoe kymatousa]MBT9313707.1 septal ring lytic transglycosylase RlpA family protein [Leptothoe kymatousa TAU-MAC 1615]
MASPKSPKATVNVTTAPAVRTLLPQGSFQQLEPLNLADVAADVAVVLDQVLTLPTQAPTKVQALVSSVAVADTVSAAPKKDDFAASLKSDTASARSGKASVSTLMSKPVVMELQKQTSAPVVLREELAQCVDAERPESGAPTTTNFQLLKQGVVVGNMPDISATETLIASLGAMLGAEAIDPDAIRPVLDQDEPAIQLGQDVLLTFTNQDGALEQSSGVGSEWTAITWSDQLRQSMGATPLDPGQIQVMLKQLQPSGQELDGLASWYGPYFHGRLTANGEIFDQDTLTAAHKTLPFDTVLQVRNLKNNRTVVVRINDRGPYIGKRSLDLSRAAARCLGGEKVGVIPYEAVIMD